MKKVLLTAVALAAGSASLHAQQRLALYEEFSGENCVPCAASNPALWTLLSANTSKVLLIKYQSPIPSAGPIYNAYTTVTNARLSYYSVPFAPYGRLDGTVQGVGSSSPGHVNYLTQGIINTEAAAPTPFNITSSHQWNATGDSVTVSVNLAALSAYAPAGANLKLRVALIEHLQYPVAPGTNGETEFHNVVREMYPNAGGTQLPNAWTAGQSQSFTLKGRVPSYVDKAGVDTRVAVWIQDDATKGVPQALATAPVPLPVDIASAALTVPSSLVCALDPCHRELRCVAEKHRLLGGDLRHRVLPARCRRVADVQLDRLAGPPGHGGRHPARPHRAARHPRHCRLRGPGPMASPT